MNRSITVQNVSNTPVTVLIAGNIVRLSPRQKYTTEHVEYLSEQVRNLTERGILRVYVPGFRYVDWDTISYRQTHVVPQPPVITSPLFAAFVIGSNFQYQITADNDPTSFGATNLPAGLSVSPGGLISGIVTGPNQPPGPTYIGRKALTGKIATAQEYGADLPAGQYQARYVQGAVNYGNWGGGMITVSASGPLLGGGVGTGVLVASGSSLMRFPIRGSFASFAAAQAASAGDVVTFDHAGGPISVAFTDGPPYDPVHTSDNDCNDPALGGAENPIIIDLYRLSSNAPDIHGPFNISISASNALGTDTRTLVLIGVDSAVTPVITSSATIAVTWGTSFAYQITADNAPVSFGASLSVPAGQPASPFTINGNNGLTAGRLMPKILAVNFGTTVLRYPGAPVWVVGVQTLTLVRIEPDGAYYYSSAAPDDAITVGNWMHHARMLYRPGGVSQVWCAVTPVSNPNDETCFLRATATDRVLLGSWTATEMSPSFDISGMDYDQTMNVLAEPRSDYTMDVSASNAAGTASLTVALTMNSVACFDPNAWVGAWTMEDELCSQIVTNGTAAALNQALSSGTMNYPTPGYTLTPRVLIEDSPIGSFGIGTSAPVNGAGREASLGVASLSQFTLAYWVRAFAPAPPPTVQVMSGDRSMAFGMGGWSYGSTPGVDYYGENGFDLNTANLPVYITDQWVHIALAVDLPANVVYIYANGKQRGSFSALSMTPVSEIVNPVVSVVHRIGWAGMSNAAGFVTGLSVYRGLPTECLLTKWAMHQMARPDGSMDVVPPSPVAPPIITSPGIVNFNDRLPVNYVITATNNPTSFGAPLLPPGLTILGDTISGNLFPDEITIDFGNTRLVSAGAGNPSWSPGIVTLRKYTGNSWTFPGQVAYVNGDPAVGNGVLNGANYDRVLLYLNESGGNLPVNGIWIEIIINGPMYTTATLQWNGEPSTGVAGGWSGNGDPNGPSGLNDAAETIAPVSIIATTTPAEFTANVSASNVAGSDMAVVKFYPGSA